MIMAVWSLVIKARAIKIEVSTHKAEELGSYQLDFMIGKGGMGEVWRARHKMLWTDARSVVLLRDGAAGRGGFADVGGPVRAAEREPIGLYQGVGLRFGEEFGADGGKPDDSGRDGHGNASVSIAGGGDGGDQDRWPGGFV